jgi:hypothetical protein
LRQRRNEKHEEARGGIDDKQSGIGYDIMERAEKAKEKRRETKRPRSQSQHKKRPYPKPRA